MADVSASAAKEHVLKGSGDVARISKEAVNLARELAEQYLTRLGAVAAEAARSDRRKTLMPQDLQIAQKSIEAQPATAGSDGSGVVPAP